MKYGGSAHAPKDSGMGGTSTTVLALWSHSEQSAAANLSTQMEFDHLNGWIKKKQHCHICKNHTPNSEHQRYSWNAEEGEAAAMW